MLGLILCQSHQSIGLLPEHVIEAISLQDIDIAKARLRDLHW